MTMSAFKVITLRQCVLCLWLFVNCLHATSVAVEGSPGSDCMMGGGVSGRCEELESCLADGGVVQRSDQVTVCPTHRNKIFVCCRKPRKIADELCSSWSHYWRGDKNCSKDNPLIIGGVDASPGEFPHIAILGAQNVRSRSITWQCGGSLLSPHFVLTAAHCVLEEDLIYWVELGAHDLSVTSEEVLPRIKGPIPQSIYRVNELRSDSTSNAPLKQRIQVAEVIRHPGYLQARKYHDLALLRLQRPVTLTKRVLPACLPTDDLEDYSDDKTVIAGWGRSGSGLSELTNVLQKATIPVKKPLECQTTIGKRDRITAAFGLLEDQICAGGDGADSCRGDSGGPMMKQIPRGGAVCEQTVVGVVSFGIGCGSFGIYVRVASYLDWITGYIAPNAS